MECPDCKGEGVVKVIRSLRTELLRIHQCFNCNGTGEMCDHCGEASDVCDGRCRDDEESDE